LVFTLPSTPAPSLPAAASKMDATNDFSLRKSFPCSVADGAWLGLFESQCPGSLPAVSWRKCSRSAWRCRRWIIW
jgi:hypothetical protein